MEPLGLWMGCFEEVYLGCGHDLMKNKKMLKNLTKKMFLKNALKK